MLTGLTYLLLSPYWQPRTHIVVLRTGALLPLEGPLVPVAGAELGLLPPLQHAATYHSSPEFNRLLASPEAMNGLSEKVRAFELHPRDVLIVYLAAHGVLDNEGEASLVCDNYNPDPPRSGLCRLSVLLNELQKTPAKTKFLILDAGQMDYEPVLGIVGSEFPTAVQQELDAREDPGLWVLCSHSDHQKSHRSAALGGSVFGSFVLKGLHGAADVDGDLAVSVGELAKFAKKHVATWVEQGSAGATQQQPQLMHHSKRQASQGNLTKEADALELLSVDHLPAKLRKLDVRELIRLATDQGERSQRRVSAGISSRGLLQRVARQTADEAQAPNSIPDDPTLAKNDEENLSPERGGEDAHPEIAANPNKNDPRPRLAKLLDNAWRMRDKIANSTTDANRPLTRPVDTTPHLWREFHEELVAYEQLLGDKQLDTTEHFSNILAESLAQFWLSDDRSQVLEDFLELSGEPKRLSRLGIDTTRLSSLSLIETLAQAEATELPERVTNARKQLDGLIHASIQLSLRSAFG